jgi:chaperonin GroEL
VVRKALAAPLRQIADNAGLDGTVVLEETLEQKASFGLNVLTGEWGDLVKAGNIDPTNLTRAARQNAASIVGLMLTTETVVTERKDEKEKVEGAVS